MLMVDSELDSELQALAGSSILRFCKMHALGNDFVVVAEDALNLAVNGSKHSACQGERLVQIARKLCSRKFGIGADGLIVVRRGSSKERLSWTYLNSDGSLSLMCGNGLRCLALWAELNGWAPGTEYFVETGKGPVAINFAGKESITSDLGEPILDPALIPINESAKTSYIAHEFHLDAEEFKISCVSMGNPHCVIFEEDLDPARLEKRALALQSHSFFPEGVNVEFVKVESNDQLKVLVYERGCGRTLACASGAAAVVVAAVLEGRTARQVRVELEGGALDISWSKEDNHVRICGPASMVFEGKVDLKSLDLEAELS